MGNENEKEWCGEFGLETRCVCGENDFGAMDHKGSISFPIYQTATFAHPALGESTGFDYSRLQNPTRECVEKTVANLEQGFDAMAFSTGMAALTTLMELFEAGDHVIASEDLYGGSIRLYQHICVRHGIHIEFVDTTVVEHVEELVTSATKAIFIETPTNPMMQVTDIGKMAEIARKYELLLVVDNTFMTPYLQNPLALGADVVLHSGTKFLGGHNDTLAGFLVVKSPELSERLRFIYKTTGACLSPFDSWLILRGIKTLALRMERQESNARQIADWLKEQEKVKSVYYVGLPEHPGYEVNNKQSRGAGSMISFHVDTKETVEHVLKNLKLIRFAESLGGVESLITYPMTQTHADVPKEEREKKGINECLLRLSVGIENVEDLIEDLKQALV